MCRAAKIASPASNSSNSMAVLRCASLTMYTIEVEMSVQLGDIESVHGKFMLAILHAGHRTDPQGLSLLLSLKWFTTVLNN
jgi:hypothetical protein